MEYIQSEEIYQDCLQSCEQDCENECEQECEHNWIFINGMKVCNKCYQEYDDSLEVYDNNVFTDTHVFMNLVNGGGLMMSGGWNKYNISSYGKAIQHMCNLNNHNYTSRLMYTNTLTIEEIVKENKLPIELIQATMNFFKTILDIKNVQPISKRYNIKQLLSSCFFYAAKSINVYITHKDIATMFKMPEKHITKGIKIFNSYMQNQSIISMLKDVTINDLFKILDNMLAKLNIEDDFFNNYCKNIIQKIYDEKIFFKYCNERIVVAVIYYAAKIHNRNVSIQKIQSIYNISPQSITKSYNILVGYNHFLID